MTKPKAKASKAKAKTKRAAQSISVCCPRCNGTGRILLPTVYEETLALVRRYCLTKRMRLNGRQLGELAGCEPTAMCQRLARMERLGLVRSERRGRERLWWVD